MTYQAAMFMDCPEYMDDDGAVRCGLPAVVKSRYMMASSDGPLESVIIRCPRGHWFNGPVGFLAIPPGAAHGPRPAPRGAPRGPAPRAPGRERRSPRRGLHGPR